MGTIGALGLTTDRLLAIERAAETARERVPNDLFSDRGRRFAIREAAGVILGGRVTARDNLRHEGHRVSGLFLPNGLVQEIQFEFHEPPRRRRFTIAHEVGHLILDPERAPICLQALPDDEPDPDALHEVAEDEADAFAAAFLIPSNLLLEDVENLGACARLLSDIYEVTEPAMRLRMAVVRELSA